MKPIHSWANSSMANPEDIRSMIAQLEERAQCPDQQMLNSAFVKILDPIPGEHLLEVGCGSGVLCRLVAPKIAPQGLIFGVDISTEFIKAARQFSANEGCLQSILFSSANAESLPFSEGSFDSVFAARLLLHTANPEAVVKEMARVVKRGGSVVVMDWDFETVVVNHSKRELTRRLLHWRADYQGSDNWSGRKLFKYLTGVGLDNLCLFPVVSVAWNAQDSLSQSLWRMAALARDQKIISVDEEKAWLDEIKNAITEGHFFASVVYFIVSGKRV